MLNNQSHQLDRSCHLVSATQTLPWEPARHTRSAEPLGDLVLQVAGRQLSLPTRHTLDAGDCCFRIWTASCYLTASQSAPPQAQHTFSPLPQTSPRVTLHSWSTLRPGPAGVGWHGGRQRKEREGHQSQGHQQPLPTLQPPVLLHHAYDVRITGVQ